MAKPVFFLVYEDDEEGISISKHLEEGAALKEAADVYKQFGSTPKYMIRGEQRKIRIKTLVSVEEV